MGEGSRAPVGSSAPLLWSKIVRSIRFFFVGPRCPGEPRSRSSEVERDRSNSFLIPFAAYLNIGVGIVVIASLLLAIVVPADAFLMRVVVSMRRCLQTLHHVYSSPGLEHVYEQHDRHEHRHEHRPSLLA